MAVADTSLVSTKPGNLLPAGLALRAPACRQRMLVATPVWGDRGQGFVAVRCFASRHCPAGPRHALASRPPKLALPPNCRPAVTVCHASPARVRRVPRHLGRSRASPQTAAQNATAASMEATRGSVPTDWRFDPENVRTAPPPPPPPTHTLTHTHTTTTTTTTTPPRWFPVQLAAPQHRPTLCSHRQRPAAPRRKGAGLCDTPGVVLCRPRASSCCPTRRGGH